MKRSLGCKPQQRCMIVNEASLITALQIDEMVHCNEVYEHGDCLSIILEFMDNGSMADIVTKYHD